MRLRVDVGIHAQGNGCPLAGLAGDGVEPLQFRRGFDVETEDAGRQGLTHFFFSLADPGKHHFGRIAASGDDARQLPA